MISSLTPGDLLVSKVHDVVVLGVGGMGSAALYHLAKRGLSVMGIEQFEPGHDRGSSHGLSRIIRLAYFEHPSYVPLLRRSFALWRELEEESGKQLLHVTGAIDAGVPGSRVLEGSLESCRVHGLPHEVFPASEVNRRFPGYHLPDEFRAVFQPDGGFLEPEQCIVSHVRRALELGATIHSGTRVRSWHQDHDGVVIHLDNEAVRAKQVVICAGAWMSQVVPSLAPLLRPERQVVGWFGITGKDAFRPEHFPVFVMTTPDGHFYGFPEHGVPGFKIGKYHHRSEPADPDAVRRTVDAADEAVLRDCVRLCFPAADGPLLRASTCLFTNTPDEHFIIDWLPESRRALVVSACSGHGFKFCSVVGEIVADLMSDGATRHDLSLFRLGRFGQSDASGTS